MQGCSVSGRLQCTGSGKKLGCAVVDEGCTGAGVWIAASVASNGALAVFRAGGRVLVCMRGWWDVHGRWQGARNTLVKKGNQVE